MTYELLNLYDKKKVLKCHHFLYIFSRRRIDIFRFVSNEIGFDISCKLHEILKPTFFSGRIRTILYNVTC